MHNLAFQGVYPPTMLPGLGFGPEVLDIQALVYDIGDEDRAGLLGNDFLQHFQVDLDSVKGVLRLRKK